MARIRKPEEKNTSKDLEIVWYIAVYVRLSREDGNDESLSITNQKKIIEEYLNDYFEDGYVVVDIYIDNGITGTSDDERKDFQRMLEDIEAKRVNCVICKTLSRAFRNYADQGYYLEDYFPRHDIRFIAISNPHVDSYVNPAAAAEGLEIPITGIMNDRYAGKTSLDVRRTFNTKRRRGEFIGAFAPYGYIKDPQDKNSLLIDEEAAPVVRNVFDWFVSGMSMGTITRKLNELGILCPTAYKRAKGFKYCNCHDTFDNTLWNPSTVRGILSNQMYVGDMVQGRYEIKSYKVHKQIKKPPNEWFIVEGTHEAIVSRELFDKVQELLKRDTRIPPKRESVYLFSGLLRCADCKKAMHRCKSKNQVYYVCRTYKEKLKQACSKHTIREDELTKAVLIAIRHQVALSLDYESAIQQIRASPAVVEGSRSLDRALEEKEALYHNVIRYKQGLYQSLQDGDLSREEYRRLKIGYEEQLETIEQELSSLRKEIQSYHEIGKDNNVLESFTRYANIETLERNLLLELVENIYVHQGKHITIVFKFCNEYMKMAEFIESNRTLLS